MRRRERGTQNKSSKKGCVSALLFIVLVIVVGGPVTNSCMDYVLHYKRKTTLDEHCRYMVFSLNAFPEPCLDWSTELTLVLKEKGITRQEYLNNPEEIDKILKKRRREIPHLRWVYKEADGFF